MENFNNKKSIIKLWVDRRFEDFFSDIERNLDIVVSKVDSDFQDLLQNYDNISLKIYKLNKIQPSFKLSLLEKICDSKIQLIKKVQESYTEEFILEQSFENNEHSIEDAFYEDDVDTLINENVLSDMEVDLQNAKCDAEVLYRIDDLYDLILLNKKQVA